MPKAPKTRRDPTAEARTCAAIAGFRAGHYRSPHAAALAHNANPKTVRNRLSGKTRSHSTAHKNQMRISPAGEEAIVQYCLYLADAGFPCRVATLRDIAFQVALSENPRNTTQLGRRFFTQFLRRHEEVRVVYARSIAIERAIANNHPMAIDKFFDLYTQTKADYNVKDPDVWNMDETGFTMGWANSCKVVAMRGRRRIVKTIPGNREWCSSVDAISMGGTALPPFNIFKGKQFTRDFSDTVRLALPEATTALTDNGWSNTEMGYQWLQHFEKHSQRPQTWARDERIATGDARRAALEARLEDIEESHLIGCKSGYRLLIMDGHTSQCSHVNKEFVSYCWANKIVPLCLPAHTTHILQPLDLVIFRKLKKAYSEAVDKSASCGITGIDKEKFVKILGEIRSTVFTSRNIMSAFAAAGLSPLDPSKAKARCTIRAPTQSPERNLQPAILSSPLHPPTPRSERTRSRFSATIVNPTTSMEAREACVQKLINFQDALAHQNRLLTKENRDLRENKEERQNRQQKKRVRLTTTATVLTNQQMDEIDDIQKAAEQKKIDDRLKRDEERKRREAEKQQEEAALQARKEARARAAVLRKEKERLKKEVLQSQRNATQLERTASDIFKRLGPRPTFDAMTNYQAAVAAHKDAVEERHRLNELHQQASRAHEEACDLIAALDRANPKSKKASRQEEDLDEVVDAVEDDGICDPDEVVDAEEDDGICDLESNSPGEDEVEFFQSM